MAIEWSLGRLFDIVIYAPYCDCGSFFVGDTGEHMDSANYEQWYDIHSSCGKLGDQW